MDKLELLKTNREILDWVKSLEEMDEEMWFHPLSEGKWATADVISHFISWDRFCLDHRIPYIEKQLRFPKLDVNVEKINKDASVYARSGITKQQLIHEYIQTKEMVLSVLDEWPESVLRSTMKIGQNEIEVGEYFHYILNMMKSIDRK